MKSKNSFKDETERIKANPYLVKKLNQGRKDMKNAKGIKIPFEDLWNDLSSN
jgi:hypothetical protein